MWVQMQIKSNFQKFSQKVKHNICDQTKWSNFHNKAAKLPCAEVQAAMGVTFCYMLYHAIVLFV